MTNAPKSPSANLKRRLVIFVFLACAVGLAVGATWFAAVKCSRQDRIFRGKPESVWIKNLKYWDEEQVKEWRGYGPEGVQVLIRGLQRANRPGERLYRQIYRHSPGFLKRWAPYPSQDSSRATRMCVADVLSRLGTDAKAAIPIMKWTLIHDEADSVRQIAIGFFNSTEDEKCFFNQMRPEERANLLPALLRDVKDGVNWGLRNNAVLALKWFPEERERVVPALTNALHDAQPQVALVATESLNHIAPGMATNIGAVPILAQILKSPDDQIAHRAADLLGELKADPSVSVPALIEGMNSTNQLVSVQSTLALLKFDRPDDVIVPALETAMTRSTFPAWLTNQVRQRIERTALPK
jgi:hypothetical protein